jgi:hypothetical protein
VLLGTRPKRKVLYALKMYHHALNPKQAPPLTRHCCRTSHKQLGSSSYRQASRFEAVPQLQEPATTAQQAH